MPRREVEPTQHHDPDHYNNDGENHLTTPPASSLLIS
jgi:hypothetical protein